MGNAARALLRRLNATQTDTPAAVDDPMAVELMRKLEGLGMGKYLPDDDPEEERRQALRDLAEWNRRYNSGEYDEERKARQLAEETAKRRETMSTAELFREALSQANHAPANTDHIPLNGHRVTDAVRRGLGGATVNGV